MVVGHQSIGLASLPDELANHLRSPSPNEVLQNEHAMLVKQIELGKMKVVDGQIVAIESNEEPIFVTSSSESSESPSLKFLPQLLLKEIENKRQIGTDNLSKIFIVIHYSMLDGEWETFEAAEQVLEEWAKKVNKSLKIFADSMEIDAYEVKIKLYRELDELHGDPLEFFHRERFPKYHEDAEKAIPTAFLDCSPQQYHESYLNVERPNGFPEFTVLYTVIKGDADAEDLKQISKSIGNGQSLFKIGEPWDCFESMLNMCSKFAIRSMIQAESGVSLRPAFHEESLLSSSLLSDSKLGHVKLLSHKKDETLPNSPFGVVRDLSSRFEPAGKKKILHNAISSLCEGINRCQVPSTNIRDALEYLKKTWQDESVRIFGGRKFQIGDKKGDRQSFNESNLDTINEGNIKNLLKILKRDCKEYEQFMQDLVLNKGDNINNKPLGSTFPRTVEGVGLDSREYVLFFESFSKICLKLWIRDTAIPPLAHPTNLSIL